MLCLQAALENQLIVRLKCATSTIKKGIVIYRKRPFPQIALLLPFFKNTFMDHFDFLATPFSLPFLQIVGCGQLQTS